MRLKIHFNLNKLYVKFLKISKAHCIKNQIFERKYNSLKLLQSSWMTSQTIIMFEEINLSINHLYSKLNLLVIFKER
jgi:hypothetical protein